MERSRAYNGVGLLVAALSVGVCLRAAGADEKNAPGVPHVGEPEVSARESRLLQKAEAVAKEQGAEAAAALLRNERPEDASAAIDFAIGVYFHQAGQHAAAGESYAAALEDAPGFSRAWLNLGHVRLAQERPRAAAKAFAHLLRLRGPNAPDYVLLGMTRLLAGQSVAAEGAFRTALALDADAADAAQGLVQACLDGQRHDEAAAVLRELLQRAPLNGQWWQMLAGVQLQQTDDDGALLTLESAHRLGLLDGAWRLRLASLYMQRNQPAQALPLYRQADADALTAQQRLHLATALHGLDDSAAARAALEPLLQQDGPQAAQSWLLAARLDLEDDKQQGAIEALQKALQHDPLLHEALLLLGRLHREAGRLEQAELTWERAARLKPARVRALSLLAQLDVARGRIGQALVRLDEALAEQPSPELRRYQQQIADWAQQLEAQ